MGLKTHGYSFAFGTGLSDHAMRVNTSLLGEGELKVKQTSVLAFQTLPSGWKGVFSVDDGGSATSSTLDSGGWMSIPTKQLVNSLHCGVASNESR